MSSISGEFYNEKQFQKARGCSGKRRFSTWEEAGKESIRLFEKKQDLCAPYHCTICHGYHNGHNQYAIKEFFAQRISEMQVQIEMRTQTIREQRTKLKEQGAELHFRQTMQDHCGLCRLWERVKRIVL